MAVRSLAGFVAVIGLCCCAKKGAPVILHNAEGSAVMVASDIDAISTLLSYRNGTAGAQRNLDAALVDHRLFLVENGVRGQVIGTVNTPNGEGFKVSISNGAKAGSVGYVTEFVLSDAH